MSVSWNEIRSRAAVFMNEWEGESRERSEAQSFWNDFFRIFAVSRRRVARFEEAVKKLAGQGFIDLFWPGVLVVEHKSAGEDLESAYGQALDYFEGLREEELPRYVVVSDFQNFRLYDLEEGVDSQFRLDQLLDRIELFGFIAGYEKRTYEEQDPVNIEAAVQMGRLHDALRQSGYSGHELEVYLVRLPASGEKEKGGPSVSAGGFSAW